eukprot:m.112197 g.112197  ORF g.112197 m.112197 type:complete len:593 (-) comp15970_c4_seq1:600-2378(-)
MSEPHINGGPPAYGSYDRSDLTRLIAQALSDLGYPSIAKSLEKESGVSVELPIIEQIRSACLKGEWDQLDRFIDTLDIPNPEDKKACRFLVLEQKLLECVAEKKVAAALMCLRLQLSPLQMQEERLQQLSCAIMCPNIDAVKADLDWRGGGEEGRHALLDALLKRFPTALMVPPRRLEVLLGQATSLQAKRCLYHNGMQKPCPLLEDHTCRKESLPRTTRAVLRGHADEVWLVRFSPSGKYLASSSKDRTAIIWDVHRHTKLHTLNHTDAVNNLAWSADETKLLTCGGDEDRRMIMWDVASGRTLRVFDGHKEGVTACAWTPDGQRIASGSTDQRLILWNSATGEMIHCWPKIRAIDIAMEASGASIIVVCHEKKIRRFNLNTFEEELLFQEQGSVTSLSLSADGSLAMVNLVHQDIHVWDLRTRQVVRKYKGHKQERFAIRSCFGGATESFVLSGSEDARVYIWHQDSERLLEELAGHGSTVNAVSWHPREPMFASASDDNTIRLWGPATGMNGTSHKGEDANHNGNHNGTEHDEPSEEEDEEDEAEEEEEEDEDEDDDDDDDDDQDEGRVSAAELQGRLMLRRLFNQNPF